MLLRYFYDRALAQASYMVGCQACGEAIIIDPARDIAPYMEAAQQEGLRIAHVTETHIHADFVSGALELAVTTGARLYLSAEGGDDWSYRWADDETVLLRAGDSIRFGGVRLDVLHTPGHTPEHLAFMLTDRAGADEPFGIFTGDCLFVGDMGRPDLLETAAGVSGSKEIGARGQFANMQRLRAMPDYLQVFPGHGAGSACGKALGALPSSTLGYEKRFNPAFRFDDETAFFDWLLAAQPETPPYFAQMKRVNRDGVMLLNNLPSLRQLDPIWLPGILDKGLLVIDARPLAAYTAGHIVGTVNIPPGDKFNTYAGYLIDYTQPYYVIAEADAMPEIARLLHAVGADRLDGYWTPETLQFDMMLPSITAQDAAARIASGEAHLLDVRAQSEYDARHIATAHHLPLPFLSRQWETLPRTQPIIVHCASGHRSQIATSYLRAQGFTDVINLSGGMDGWRAAGLPLVEE
jgi:hydroxyacylglutathione hydrolase